MLKMIDKRIRGKKCHAIHQNTEAKKYTKDYNKNKESSYLMYWDANNLYRWAMSHKIHVESFEFEK